MHMGGCEREEPLATEADVVSNSHGSSEWRFSCHYHVLTSSKNEGSRTPRQVFGETPHVDRI